MPPTRTRRLKGGRLVALLMAGLWVAILIAVYVVIVRLKLGGEEGIMREDRRPAEITTEPAADTSNEPAAKPADEPAVEPAVE